MSRLLITFLSACPLVAEGGETTGFFYPTDVGGPLTCNGQVVVGTAPPFECSFSDLGDGRGELLVSLQSWGWEGKALLTREGSATTITGGFCAGSVSADPNVADAYQLDPACLAGDGPPPPATGPVLVEEWFSDLPWHQKLSTKDSNLIDAPFVLPFAALPARYRETAACTRDQAGCMLRYGIVNIMGMHRTDTLYDEAQTRLLTEAACREAPCVEVRLDIQRFHTATNDAKGYAADEIRNNKRTYIDQQGDPQEVISLGFAVTEATIFAPWRPWYTGHYCALFADNIADSVCYEDYFTTQLVAATPPKESWIKDAPAFFWPRGTEPELNKFCQSGQDACSMYLGKVDWLNDALEPKVVACDQPAPYPALPVTECQAEVLDRTQRLDIQFNDAITQYLDTGRYPWYEARIESFSEDIKNNPFIGFYELQRSQVNKDTGLFMFDSPHYALPKRCTKANYLGARQGSENDVQRLADCVVNFEIHTNGFYELWKELYGGGLPLSDDAVRDISKAIPGVQTNQYGRTMFMYAGVPEQHVPVSFKMLGEPTGAEDEPPVERLSTYDKVYNASLYTQYLPMVNPADLTLKSKSYTDDFWHSFFMSNHMNQTPDHFIRGVRGRTLWHNEYRSNLMFKAAVDVGSDGKRTVDGTQFEHVLEHVDFAAGFQVTPEKGLAPFHGNTCDSCHIRNGSGIPLMPNGHLPDVQVDHGMKSEYKINRDYTYSNTEQTPLKMVFFDLKDNAGRRDACDDNNHTIPKEIGLTPLGPARGTRRLYSNKIMNFFGNSFHLYQNQNRLSYRMEYVDLCGGDGFEVVDTTLRRPTTRGAGSACPPVGGYWSAYQPKRATVDLSQIRAGDVCNGLAALPDGVDAMDWPSRCDEVAGGAIDKAIRDGEIGFMHLLGRRLGNTPMIELVPEKVIVETQRQQALDEDMGVAGCISLAPGTRSGGAGEFNYRKCSSGKRGTDRNDCYIGRWGWIGDRASLEDQVANAAHVEMNITSSDGFEKVHPNVRDDDSLVRYDGTLCGPADADCQALAPNSDLSEQDIRDMATYQRWIGIPNRSEYQVSSEKVQKGEEIFERLKCSSCHVIKKIAFDFQDNMLPDEERASLRRLQIPLADNGGNDPRGVQGGGLRGLFASRQAPDLEYPFISYLGTDLLMHDMGYLSQVAAAPAGVAIRDKDGRVKWQYRNYVQKIRTPALKGLRFNRFVTDSNHNTAGASVPLASNFDPGCDFLLHDGRACDAIEAAYLHDGRAVKQLRMIERLNALNAEELEQLRAFLYSL